MSHRKGRLFLVACCRGIWDLLVHDGSREAVEAAEWHADGEVTWQELEAARSALQHDPDSHALDLLYEATLHVDEWQRLDIHDGGWKAVAAAVQHIQDEAAWKAAHQEKAAAQAGLIRYVFGNPFKPVPHLPPAMLGWSGGLVVKLAQAAYDDRLLPGGQLDPGRLAVLADALLDAGCTDHGLLAHLRSSGPHFRGCHVVDLLTGRC